MKYNRKKFLMIEIVIALGIIAVVMIPLASAFFREGRMLRALYYQSVAEQVLDGEREVLAAGEWRNYPVGEYICLIDNDAFKHLPEKKVVLEVTDIDNNQRKFVFVWEPAKNEGICGIRKEAIFDVD